MKFDYEQIKQIKQKKDDFLHKRIRIFKKQNGICHLCGGPMILGVPGHPYNASFDRIKPGSDGGEYLDKNVRLAHSWCNSDRGNKTLKEYEILRGFKFENNRRKTKMNTAVINFMWKQEEDAKFRLTDELIGSICEEYLGSERCDAE